MTIAPQEEATLDSMCFSIPSIVLEALNLAEGDKWKATLSCKLIVFLFKKLMCKIITNLMPLLFLEEKRSD